MSTSGTNKKDEKKDDATPNPEFKNEDVASLLAYIKQEAEEKAALKERLDALEAKEKEKKTEDYSSLAAALKEFTSPRPAPADPAAKPDRKAWKKSKKDLYKKITSAEDDVELFKHILDYREGCLSNGDLDPFYSKDLRADPDTIAELIEESLDNSEDDPGYLHEELKRRFK